MSPLLGWWIGDIKSRDWGAIIFGSWRGFANLGRSCDCLEPKAKGRRLAPPPLWDRFSRLSVHDSPSPIGLLTGPTARRLRPAVDEDLLRVIRAAEAVGIVVVVGHAEVAVIAVPRIVPLIGGV